MFFRVSVTKTKMTSKINKIKLKLMQINTRSIRPKQEELRELLTDESIDILAVNES